MRGKYTYKNAGASGAGAPAAGTSRGWPKRGSGHRRMLILYLVLYDMAAVNLSYFLGLWLRFDLRFSQIPREYLESFVRFAPVYTLFAVLVFAGLSLYRSLWRFASYSELNRILGASAITAIFSYGWDHCPGEADAGFLLCHRAGDPDHPGDRRAFRLPLYQSGKKQEK